MKYYAYINSMKSESHELGECATLKKAYIKLVALCGTFRGTFPHHKSRQKKLISDNGGAFTES